MEFFTGICISRSNCINYFLADLFADPFVLDWNKNITEIIAPDTHLNVEFCMTCHPQIEKIKVKNIWDVRCLTRLKYLCITGPTKLDTICSELPDTIETLILPQCQYAPISLDQLNKFPHLNYLAIEVLLLEFSITLCINTIYLGITASESSFFRLYNFYLPNIKNVIVDFGQAEFYPPKLHLTASNATTCHIMGVEKYNLSVVSPNCSEVIIRHYKPDQNYNSDVFIPKRLGIVEWLLNGSKN